ncbi:lysozyme inhibitor LprI family protein [Legionella fallonii]|uniref:Lysozyme inhibitor LprI-like N-terminal domain-containing protein n=1 Tax=Legionella fallonii LLAP-10 TaxID=1212491 RepID=A0A098G4Z5_9GAMM|nr:lysozyme inhibitor LprI family protein [Legionella fallonii]CEG57064.1 conserved exported protein of unknown function [Legionella fallonii LLAP-10]
MKLTKGALAFFLFLNYLSPASAETQYELNKAACDQLQKSDNSLNKVYQQVIARYKDDQTFISQFTTAQKKWIAFRDAYVASMYIPQYKESYGSVLPMCQCYMLEHITLDRIKQLQVWLDGVAEGDVCVGSVKS